MGAFLQTPAVAPRCAGRRWVSLACLVLTALWISTAPARTSDEVTLGGPGGEPFRITCGNSRYLVGLAGTASDALERLQPICARVDALGHWKGAPLTLLAVGGGLSGQAIMFRSTCPRDTVVEGFESYSGQFVYHVTLWCRQQGPDGTSRVFATPRTVGGQQHIKTGESGGCGPNQAANGIVGRAGAIIDAFGVTCGTILVGVPQPVPPAAEDQAFVLGPNFQDRAPPPGMVMETPEVGGVVTRIPEGIGVDGPPAQEVGLPQDFTNPTYRGIALDQCQSWGKGCGKPAADSWCTAQLGTKSAGYRVRHNAPPTITQFDGAICREEWCTRFVVITCLAPSR